MLRKILAPRGLLKTRDTETPPPESKKNRPLSALNHVLRAHFYTRRFGPNESGYLSRFENRDPSRFQRIRKKNRPERFQIENDSQKGGTIPGRSCHKPALPMLWFKGMSGKTWPLNPRFLTIPCWGPDGKPMRSGRPAQADYLPLECLGGERCNV